MTSRFKIISPVDGSVYVERPLATVSDIDVALTHAVQAQTAWAKVDVSSRQRILSAAIEAFVCKSDDIAREITWQMGRPISQSSGEVRGFAERARYMISIAPTALEDISPTPQAGFKRFIRRVPLGVVAVIAPWNYPYLTAVNTIIPALMAGNAVVLKHSHQTPLCAERLAEAFAKANLPGGVFQYLHLNHIDTERLIADPKIDHVNFTGSAAGGRAVQRAITEKFIDSGLELGGKDPAYVRADANLNQAIESLVDGAFFNSGQSCCSIERIYVQGAVYDDFVEGFVNLTRRYRLGDPRSGHHLRSHGPHSSGRSCAAADF